MLSRVNTLDKNVITCYSIDMNKKIYHSATVTSGLLLITRQGVHKRLSNGDFPNSVQRGNSNKWYILSSDIVQARANERIKLQARIDELNKLDELQDKYDLIEVAKQNLE